MLLVLFSNETHFAIVANENNSMSGIDGTGTKVARLYSHSPELSNRMDTNGRKNGGIEKAKSPFWSKQTPFLITLRNNTLCEFGLSRLGFALHLFRHGVQERIYQSHHGKYTAKNST